MYCTKYHALQAKLCSLKAKLFTQEDYELLIKNPSTYKEFGLLNSHEIQKSSVQQEYSRLAMYIYVKPVREFVKTLVKGLTSESMDLSYYLQIWKAANRLDKSENVIKMALRRVIGTEADLHNIIWVYRLKRYYHLHDEAIYGYLLPIGYHLNPNSMEHLVEAKDTAALLAGVAATPYQDIFPNFNNPEQKVANAVLRAYRKEARSSPILDLCTYLYEKHLESKNLFAIAEGLRLKLRYEDIFNALL